MKILDAIRKSLKNRGSKKFYFWCRLPDLVKCMILSYVIGERYSSQKFINEVKQYALTCKEFYNFYREKFIWGLIQERFIVPHFVIKKVGDLNIKGCWMKYLISYSGNKYQLTDIKGNILAVADFIFSSGGYLVEITKGEGKVYMNSYSKECIVYSGTLPEYNLFSKIQYLSETEIGAIIWDEKNNSLYHLQNLELKLLCKINGVWKKFIQIGYDGLYLKHTTFASWQNILKSVDEYYTIKYFSYVLNRGRHGDLLIHLNRTGLFKLSLINEKEKHLSKRYYHTVKPIPEMIFIDPFMIYKKEVIDPKGNVVFDTIEKYIQGIIRRDDGCGYFVIISD